MRISVLLLSFLFALQSINAQAIGSFTNNKISVSVGEKFPAEKIKAAKEAGEILLFETKRIELGPLKKGDFKTFKYRFLNIGNETIEYNFFDVCSCSKLEYDQYAKIKPGEVGEFTITFDSKEREDEEPVEVNFELKNIDKRNKMPYFYSVDYTFSFKK